MTRDLFRRWVGPPFGRCRRCGDRVKRPAARLCSSCWWASKRESQDSNVTVTRSGVAS